VRVVWITMLALKDRTGFVGGSVVGLARVAGVELEEFQDAVKRLAAPDKHSQTRDNQGRRIEVVEGGWVVLNAELFENRMKEITKRVGNAKRQREFRKRNKQGKPLNQETNTVKSVADGDMSQDDADRVASETREHGYGDD
jgi:hypothetical protein